MCPSRAGRARVGSAANRQRDPRAQGKPLAKIRSNLIMADVGRKAIAQVKQSSKRAAGAMRLPAKQAAKLTQQLASGSWTHDYPIWASTAKRLSLPVNTDMLDSDLELLKVYPQPVRIQNSGGVGYLPVLRSLLAERILRKWADVQQGPPQTAAKLAWNADAVINGSSRQRTYRLFRRLRERMLPHPIRTEPRKPRAISRAAGKARHFQCCPVFSRSALRERSKSCRSGTRGE